jgi:hypothetical protein
MAALAGEITRNGHALAELRGESGGAQLSRDGGSSVGPQSTEAVDH